jgi:hypothetical protein
MLLKGVNLVLLVVVASLLIMTVYRVLADPGNHVACDPRWLWIGYVAAIFVGGIQVAVDRKLFVLPALLLLVGLLGLGLGLYIEHYNILVQYDRWCAKGMPDRFEPPKRPDY